MTQDGRRATAIGHLSDSGELKTLCFRKKNPSSEAFKIRIKNFESTCNFFIAYIFNATVQTQSNSYIFK